jgi:hypothetical protein
MRCKRLAGGVGLLEAGDQIGEGAAIDAATVLSGGDRQTNGQVRLADARRTGIRLLTNRQ